MSRRSSNSRVGSTLVAFAILLQLALFAHPATAIGGWETIHLVWGRLSGERAAAQSSSQPSKPSSIPQVAPIPNGGGHHDADEKEDTPKKGHVNEVTMTSSKRSSPPYTRSTAVVNPAFVPRGRRGGMKLDDEDLQTINFVRRTNPFL